MNDAWTRKIGVNHNGMDEWYTPKEAVIPLLHFIKPHSTILCPFDTKESEYVKTFTENGCNVIHSHISEGIDFFNLEKPEVDYIISNPPFSKRDEVLLKLYEWNIPFAMIFNVNGIFDSKIRFSLAKKHYAQIMYLSPRVKYIDSQGNRNSPPFQSAYWCNRMLYKDVLFEEIPSGV